MQDSLQEYAYELVAPVGKNFNSAFTPELSPQQMLEIGVFGGYYFENEHQEFPKEWFKNARLSNRYDTNQNFFQVDSGMTRAEWQARGWIYTDDPRGWFQWYCRYYYGRRIPEEDARQIKRWRLIKRHVSQLQKACFPGDLTCRRKQRQALLHWAYDSRKL